jgi:hypothetical protein
VKRAYSGGGFSEIKGRVVQKKILTRRKLDKEGEREDDQTRLII